MQMGPGPMMHPGYGMMPYGAVPGMQMQGAYHVASPSNLSSLQAGRQCLTRSLIPVMICCLLSLSSDGRLRRRLSC